MKTLSFILLILMSSVLHAQINQQPPLIKVSGSASVNVAPDVVIFTLERKIDMNNQVSNDIFSTLNNEDNLNFIFLNNYDIKWCFENIKIEKNDSYVAKNVIVTLNDITKLKEIISELHKQKKFYIKKMEFRSSKLSDYQNEVKILALNRAKKNAELIAKEMGVSIVKPYRIEDKISSFVNYYDESQTSIDFKNLNSDSYLVNPGFISVISIIDVSYEIK